MHETLDTYKTDRIIFEKVINEKIKRETEHSNLGKSIGQLLEENGITENNYLKQAKFTHYDDLPQTMIEERL